MHRGIQACVITFGKLGYQRICSTEARRLANMFVIVTLGRIAKSNVLSDLQSCEQKRSIQENEASIFSHREWKMGIVLEEDRHGLPDVMEFQSANIVTVEQDIPLFRIVKPQREFQYSALPRPIGPYNDLRTMSAVPWKDLRA